jgi:hypothetical protein
LKKNYLLIIGQHEREYVWNLTAGQDSVLRKAQEIAFEDGVESLFDYQEPEILTRQFYSGRRAEDAEDYDPSPR